MSSNNVIIYANSQIDYSRYFNFLKKYSSQLYICSKKLRTLCNYDPKHYNLIVDMILRNRTIKDYQNFTFVQSSALLEVDIEKQVRAELLRIFLLQRYKLKASSDNGQDGEDDGNQDSKKEEEDGEYSTTNTIPQAPPLPLLGI